MAAANKNTGRRVEANRASTDENGAVFPNLANRPKGASSPGPMVLAGQKTSFAPQ
jgi:hypothetical protein